MQHQLKDGKALISTQEHYFSQIGSRSGSSQTECNEIDIEASIDLSESASIVSDRPVTARPWSSDKISIDYDEGLVIVTAEELSTKNKDLCCKNCCYCCLGSFTLSCFGRKFDIVITRKRIWIGLSVLLTAVLLLIIFFLFAILPVPYIHRPIKPLTTMAPSAIGKEGTRVLLYGKSFEYIFLNEKMPSTNSIFEW